MPILSNVPLAVPVPETFISPSDNLDYHLILEKLRLISFQISSLDWLLEELRETDDFNLYRKYVSLSGIIQNRFEVLVLDRPDQIRVVQKLKQLLSPFPQIAITSEEINNSFYVYLWLDDVNLILNIQTTVNKVLREVNPAYSLKLSTAVFNTSPSNLNSVFEIIAEARAKLIKQYSELCSQLLTVSL